MPALFEPARTLTLGFCLGLVASCFEGDYAHGHPCNSDSDCGPTLACIEGLCGGPGGAGVCGNGLIDVGEACDNGEANDDLTGDCTSECELRAPVCGNMLVEGDEECDDGNTYGGDFCTSECLLPACGDGFVGPGETCDDANMDDSDFCPTNCQLAHCGDGFVGPNEACDDANMDDSDFCPTNCQLAHCGDGFVGPNEACDDGNAIEVDGCTSACTESPLPPILELQLAQVKQFELSWSLLGDAFFQLFERAPADGPWVQIGGNLESDSLALTVPLHFRSGWIYRLKVCDGDADAIECVSSEVVPVVGDLGEAVGYFKASNAGYFDQFGKSVVLSGDGNTLAVGAPYEDGGADGVNPPDEDDNSAVDAGAGHGRQRRSARPIGRGLRGCLGLHPRRGELDSAGLPQAAQHGPGSVVRRGRGELGQR